MIAALLTLAMAAATADLPCFITDHSARAALSFDDHPAKVWRGAPAKPVLDAPYKRLFRTALRQGAAQGPNFAGHITIVRWGCGTACVAWAAVDARTGKVTKLLGSDYISTMHVGGELGGVNFKPDSRLLVLAGAPRENERREGLHTYLWTGNGFRQLNFLPQAKTCEPYDAP